MNHPLYATFLEMETDAKAAMARRNNLAVGILSIEETADIAMRAASAHGIPWPEARAILIAHFTPRAG